MIRMRFRERPSNCEATRKEHGIKKPLVDAFSMGMVPLTVIVTLAACGGQTRRTADSTHVTIVPSAIVEEEGKNLRPRFCSAQVVKGSLSRAPEHEIIKTEEGEVLVIPVSIGGTDPDKAYGVYKRTVDLDDSTTGNLIKRAETLKALLLSDIVVARHVVEVLAATERTDLVSYKCAVHMPDGGVRFPELPRVLHNSEIAKSVDVALLTLLQPPEKTEPIQVQPTPIQPLAKVDKIGEFGKTEPIQVQPTPIQPLAKVDKIGEIGRSSISGLRARKDLRRQAKFAANYRDNLERLLGDQKISEVRSESKEHITSLGKALERANGLLKNQKAKAGELKRSLRNMSELNGRLRVFVVSSDIKIQRQIAKQRREMLVALTQEGQLGIEAEDGGAAEEFITQLDTALGTSKKAVTTLRWSEAALRKVKGGGEDAWKAALDDLRVNIRSARGELKGLKNVISGAGGVFTQLAERVATDLDTLAGRKSTSSRQANAIRAHAEKIRGATSDVRTLLRLIKQSHQLRHFRRAREAYEDLKQQKRLVREGRAILVSLWDQKNVDADYRARVETYLARIDKASTITGYKSAIERVHRFIAEEGKRIEKKLRRLVRQKHIRGTKYAAPARDLADNIREANPPRRRSRGGPDPEKLHPLLLEGEKMVVVLNNIPQPLQSSSTQSSSKTPATTSEESGGQPEVRQPQISAEHMPLLERLGRVIHKNRAFYHSNNPIILNYNGNLSDCYTVTQESEGQSVYIDGGWREYLFAYGRTDFRFIVLVTAADIRAAFPRIGRRYRTRERRARIHTRNATSTDMLMIPGEGSRRARVDGQLVEQIRQIITTRYIAQTRQNLERAGLRWDQVIPFVDERGRQVNDTVERIVVGEITPAVREVLADICTVMRT